MALTADARAEACLRSAAAGMSGYLTKPIEARALYAALESLVAKSTSSETPLR